MSLTFLAWLLVLLFCVIRGLSKPAWMFCAYFQTVFAAPAFWWWGLQTPAIAKFSWNFYSALLVVASIMMNRGEGEKNPSDGTGGDIGFVPIFVLLACVNVAFVQFLLAEVPEQSFFFASLFWKQAVLLVCFYLSVRTFEDLLLILKAIFAGCAYISFEVVVREQGYFEKGRLEGIGIPGAADSNLISGILLLGLLIGSYFFLVTKPILQKIVFVIGSSLILLTILRCGSRGTLLALFGAGAVFLLVARGPARKRAIYLSTLGAMGLLVAARQVVWDRLFTITADAENRDRSAQERLDYWAAAIRMISDYPFGSGGEAAFMIPRGREYIKHFNSDFRAVHNGYLDIGASWGVQGLAIFLLIAIVCFYRAIRTLNMATRRRDERVTLMCALLLSLATSQLIAAVFLSSLDGELPLISLAMCFLIDRIAGAENQNQLECNLDALDQGGLV
jgi:O-antigen ligase